MWPAAAERCRLYCGKFHLRSIADLPDIVLANKCGIDLEAEFFNNVKELMEYVSKELET